MGIGKKKKEKKMNNYMYSNIFIEFHIYDVNVLMLKLAANQKILTLVVEQKIFNSIGNTFNS